MDICGYEYKPDGICAYRICFDIIDGLVRNAEVTGGCDGGHQGFSHMVEGQTPEDIINKCKTVGCHQGNSCPRQFALALEECLNKMKAVSEPKEEMSDEYAL